MNKEKLYSTVKTVTDMLAKEEYEALETLSKGVRLTAEDMKQAIAEYGRTFVLLPDNGYEEINVVEVIGSEPKEWSVYVPLFTVEEGRSDLTSELSLTDAPSNIYEAEIDNLCVL